MPLPDSTSSQCQTCGTRIGQELVHGLCPKCLLATGMALSNDEPGQASGMDETIDLGSLQHVSRQWSNVELNNNERTLGDYALLHEIARGGMGVVYKARHRTLGREVALKLILSGEFASDRDVRRFHLEAESAAALDHPGIVPIYEIRQQAGHHFFTMKFIEGGVWLVTRKNVTDRPPYWSKTYAVGLPANQFP